VGAAPESHTTVFKTSVSVVLTTFNGEQWLSPQIASICGQTRPPDEIVVCDDGSDDASLDIVESTAARRDIPVRMLGSTGQPLGTKANIERGLRAVTGDIVVLADQDDVWMPERLRLIEERFESDTDAVFSDGSLIDSRGMRLPGTVWERVGFNTELRELWASAPLAVLARRNVVTGAALAFRAAWLESILPITTPMWHDAWIALVIVGMGGTVDADPRHLIDYRLHDSNSVGLPHVRLHRRLMFVRREGLPYRETAVHFALGAQRIRSLGDPAGTATWMDGVSQFWASRSLPASVGGRIRTVAEIYRRGDYHRYGSGWRAMALDLIASSATTTVRADD
jgi:glycosyltransferase involved in cell wall biosynthesis